jgi:kinesin family member C2/C3
LEDLNHEAFNLKTKYLKELRERKKLFNQLQEIRGNIRVFCRVRPLLKTEKENMLKFPVN